MEISEGRAYLVNARETLRAEALDANNRILRTLSQTDALTGVSNRRAFDEMCDDLWRVARERSEMIGILLVDIDHFKKLNDTHGHLAGDAALQVVAACLQRNAPPGSTVARYGGEEFAIIIPEDRAYACSCAEVLRGAIERLRETNEGACLPAPITVSIGVATTRPDLNQSLIDLI